ncbi:helicase HerA domain-containing protein [Bacillus sp. N9]
MANAKKLEQSKFWVEKNYQISEEIIEKLLLDDYKISNNLKDYIGNGAILSFRKEAIFRSAEIEDGVLLLNLTEQDGYEGLVNPIKDLRDWVQKQPNDFIKEEMLSYLYKKSHGNEVLDTDEVIEDSPKIGAEDDVPTSEKETPNPDIHEDSNDDLEELEGSPIPVEVEIIQEPVLVNQESIPDEQSNEHPSLDQVRIKIGKAENSNREIYWEYGNKELANRHLLISGKSGQGKTYFMQCLLLEKSKVGIPSIVIDYTEGFYLIS